MVLLPRDDICMIYIWPGLGQMCEYNNTSIILITSYKTDTIIHCYYH